MDTEHIFEFFSDCVSGKKPNGKFQLARIYGAYEREQERISKNNPIDEQLKESHKKYSIHRISDDMAIVKYHGKAVLAEKRCLEKILEVGLLLFLMTVYQTMCIIALTRP